MSDSESKQEGRDERLRSTQSLTHKPSADVKQCPNVRGYSPTSRQNRQQTSASSRPRAASRAAQPSPTPRSSRAAARAAEERMKRWNVIATDRNEKKAKKTKLDGVLTVSGVSWVVDVTSASDELVHKSVPAGAQQALSSGDKVKPFELASIGCVEAGGGGAAAKRMGVGPFELELIDELAADEASATLPTTPPATPIARPPLHATQPPPAQPFTQPLARTRVAPQGAASPAAPGAGTPSVRGKAALPTPYLNQIGGGASSQFVPPSQRGGLYRPAVAAPQPAAAAASMSQQPQLVQRPAALWCLDGAHALTLAATLGRARPLAARGWVEPVGLTAVVCPASLVKSWEAELRPGQALVRDACRRTHRPAHRRRGTTRGVGGRERGGGAF
ncbi:hypothetical protein T492DRAFT_849675 [Pavlovales sp. CCMP2436]|nr:hypothetical protein T492DRAFT_849675 [Pavlovales sp. CCMP2436]